MEDDLPPPLTERQLQACREAAHYIRERMELYRVLEFVSSFLGEIAGYEAQRDKARAEMAEAERELRTVREQASTLLNHAKAVLAQAESDGAAIIRESQTIAQQHLANAGIR